MTQGVVVDVVGQQAVRMLPWVDRLLEKWARWRSADGWHGGATSASRVITEAKTW